MRFKSSSSISFEKERTSSFAAQRFIVYGACATIFPNSCSFAKFKNFSTSFSSISFALPPRGFLVKKQRYWHLTPALPFPSPHILWMRINDFLLTYQSSFLHCASRTLILCTIILLSVYANALLFCPVLLHDRARSVCREQLLKIMDRLF